MKTKDILLYAPHFAGKADDIRRGQNGVEVFPIAVGRFHVSRQPCGTNAAVALDRGDLVAVCLVRAFDADRRYKKSHYSKSYRGSRSEFPRKDAKDDWVQQDRKRLVANYGEPGTDTERWTIMAIPGRDIISGELYRIEQSLADEQEEKLERAARAAEITREQRAAAVGQARTAVMQLVGDVLTVAPHASRDASFGRVAGPFQPDDRGVTAKAPRTQLRLSYENATVRVSLQSVLNRQVKRRKLTKAQAQAALPPVKSSVWVEFKWLDLLDLLTKNGKVPANIQKALDDIDKYDAADKAARAEYEKVSNCRVR